jgi:plasmid stabilization system protein ParE
LRPGLRSFPVDTTVILYRIVGEDVLILHVLDGRRDIAALV